MKTILPFKQANFLTLLGLFLLFLGLVTGLFVQNLSNPRMALSAHLEGIMNGIFLIIMGLIWHKLKLSASWLKVTFWLALFGTFANFIAVLVSAITGAGKMMPLSGGREGTAFTEGFISALLITFL